MGDKYRSTYLHAVPLVITFESNASCNLRCPYCVTGSGFAARARAGKASLRSMKAIIDKAYPRSFQVAFQNNGEPFLNEEVYEAIRYARQKGLWTVVHSNLNHNDPRFAEKVLGLD